MKLQYVRAFIVLLAGLITIIINIKTGRDITISLLIVLIVIMIFYFIGTLAVEIIQKSMNLSDGSNVYNDTSDNESNEDETDYENENNSESDNSNEFSDDIDEDF